MINSLVNAQTASLVTGLLGGVGATLELPDELGAIVWLDSSDDGMFALTGSEVESWADKGSNGAPFIAANSGERPERIASDGVQFVSDYMYIVGNPLAGIEFDIFVRLKDNSNPQDVSYFIGTGGSTSNNQSLFFGADSSTQYAFGLARATYNGDYTRFNYTTTPGAKETFLYRLDATNGQRFYQDGSLLATLGGSQLLQGNQNMYVGSGYSNGPYQQTKNANFYEVLVFPKLSDADVTRVYDYLEAKYP